MKKILTFLLVFCFLMGLPLLTQAQSFDLIVCGVEGKPDCGFPQLILLVKNLINALVVISTFLATAVFAYIGIILLTSGGNESAMKRAKEMAWKVLIGYLWILGAWLLVYTITSALLGDDYSLLGKPE